MERSDTSQTSPTVFRRALTEVSSRFLTALAAFAMLGIFSARLEAALPQEGDQALPCRPTIACTADIVPPGTVELEAGILFRRLPGDGSQWTFPFLLKQTVRDWLQLQIGSNGYSVLRGPHIPAQYLDDVTIGPKFHLADQTLARPSLAVSVDASIPTFERAGYLRTYDALFTIYATKDVARVHLDLNAGLNLWRLGDGPLPQEFVALAASVALTRRFSPMLEGYIFSSAAPVASRDAGTLFALAFSPTSWLVFDGGVDLALFRDTREYSAFAGLTVIPVVLWRPKDR